MRSVLYSIALVLPISFACDPKTGANSENKNDAAQTTAGKRISIVGKWYRWSSENGYSEYDIDSKTVTVFNEKMGRNKLPYTIENDTFRYTTIEYAARITLAGDSIVLQDGDRVATLKRFSEPAFDRIPDENNPGQFDVYVRGFDERAARYPKLPNVSEPGIPVR